ncbi:MAG: protein disulfide oxidoreductase [bacterium]
MGFLSDKDKETLRAKLAALDKPVKLLLFSQIIGCPTCREAESMLKEFVGFSPKLSLEIKAPVTEKELAARYDVKGMPLLILLGDGDKDYGIRFYGTPSGYEYRTLLEDVLAVSQGKIGLKPATVERLNALPAPVDITVFVTPTCVYCPQAVFLAHQMALACEKITATMVECLEFQDWAEAHQVMGVPKSVFVARNGARGLPLTLEGAVPEDRFLSFVEKAAESAAAPA